MIPNDHRSVLSWHDVERALAASKEYFDRGDVRASYIWGTLSLATLDKCRSDVAGIRGRITYGLFRGSGYADKLEAYAHEARGAAASELHLFELARHELERARDVYLKVGEPHSEARLVRRLAHLKLLQEDWSGAELLAENALRLNSGKTTAVEKGECFLIIGHAQFRTRRTPAAIDTVDRILALPGAGPVLRGQAHLLKAMIDLDSGRLQDASDSCQEATRLFEEAGNKRGLQDVEELQRGSNSF